ncbi:hypothetical protein LDENG_00211170 [Lucifuga dentata]|nr:hypothetical protein LDENG_00211170 [Lucifuga dentata]
MAYHTKPSINCNMSRTLLCLLTNICRREHITQSFMTSTGSRSNTGLHSKFFSQQTKLSTMELCRILLLIQIQFEVFSQF